MRTFTVIAAFLVVPALARGQGTRPPSELPGGPHFAGIRWNGRVASEDSNADEFRAYHETVAFARQFAAPDLIAAGDRDVTFRDLVGRSGKDYQGKLLTLRGRLLSVRKYPASRPLREQGVEVLYECWLFPSKADDPLCLLVPELPEGVRPTVKFADPPEVEFAGYYFKLMQYDSSEPDPASPRERVARKAPLLMGRSFALRDPPAQDAAGNVWFNGFVPAFLVGVGVLTAAGLGLTWWFRRGDRATKAALAARRSVNPFESD